MNLTPETLTRTAPLRVLSVNVYMMGHIPYQQTLERVFAGNFPEIDFKSIHLLERVPRQFPLRLLLRLSRVRWPGCKRGDERDWIRFRFEFGLSTVARLIVASEMRKQPFDVIHLHTQGIAFLVPFFPPGKPCVLSIDTTAALFGRDRPDFPRSALAPILAAEKRAFHAAAHVVCWSERARVSVVEDFGVPAERTSVISPGCDPSFSGLSWERPVPEAGKPVRLLFVGNDFERKGGPELVEVFARQFSGRCELHIVSNDCPALDPVPNLFVHRGLAPLSPQLIELYRTADLFVLPTREDCFPMVFIEAMAAGLPCIGSTVMGVPELVAHGESGLNVAPRDPATLASSLETLVSNPGLRQQMGAAGRRRVEKRFNPVHNCRRLLEVFTKAARS